MITHQETALRTSVEAALKNNSAYILAGLDISINDGKVTLKGEADTDNQAEVLVKTAERIPDVQSVKDELHVRGKKNGTVSAYFEDSVITAAVKAKILGQKGLDSLDISVETVRGVVTLTGSVENRLTVKK